MRFGIMAMQMDRLVPAGLSAQESLARVVDFDHAALVRGLAEQGFDPIELGGDLALFLPQSFSAASIEKLLALKDESGLSYTVHLPLWSVEPSTPLEPVRRGSAQAVIDAVQACRPLEPEVYVLHATGALAAEFYQMRLPELAKLFLLRQFQNKARESLQMILSETGIPGRSLAIETIEFPLDLTLELADDLDLSICLDTGHVLVGFAGPVNFFEALELCLPRLAEIHLHDGPRPKEGKGPNYGLDHQALGKGDLELGRLLDRLVEANFQGPVIFELTVPEALASMEVIRSIRPDLAAQWG